MGIIGQVNFSSLSQGNIYFLMYFLYKQKKKILESHWKMDLCDVCVCACPVATP